MPRALNTLADYLARPEHEGIEFIGGSIVEKPEVTREHAMTQTSATTVLGTPFQRRPGGKWPGGWWFFTELEVKFGLEILKPDICGYRRERLPDPPQGRTFDLAPDWVCEILSPSSALRDRVEKLNTYFASGVPHYWIIDPVAGTLEVFRRVDVGYALVLVERQGQPVRPEPFDAVEFRVEDFLGADPEE